MRGCLRTGRLLALIYLAVISLAVISPIVVGIELDIGGAGADNIFAWLLVLMVYPLARLMGAYGIRGIKGGHLYLLQTLQAAVQACRLVAAV
jgi:hypothetical protein